MILRANCKINIGLDVLRRRGDGYHELETVMYPLRELYDSVEVVRSRRTAFRTHGLAIDCFNKDNLCLQAVQLMRSRYGLGSVNITLNKQVPFGAGLGGGSSDATAVILAMNELFGLHLSEAELISCAVQLGSDTAFFVRNTPQLCTGRGEVMTPFELDFAGWRLVLIKPVERIATHEAYAGVQPAMPAVPLAERLRRPLAEWQTTVKNDFEPSVFAACPAIGAVKAALLEAGAVYAAMSGSGSAVYGLFEGRQGMIRVPRGAQMYLFDL